MPLVLLEGGWSHITWFSEPLVVATRGMFGEAEKKTAPKDTEGSTEGTPTADVYRLWSEGVESDWRDDEARPIVYLGGDEATVQAILRGF
jgi:hypothetical protein